MTASAHLAAAALSLAVFAPLHAADSLLKAKPAACTDELYIEFSKNGNRTHYQRPYGQLVGTLEKLVSRERESRDGKHVAKIAEFIEAISALKSWTFPAHDASLTSFHGTPHIDLGAARLGLAFADALAVAGERLPPATRQKAKDELERRVFAPYLATARGQSKTSGHWWFRTENNWNAVCHSCVVRAALAYYPEGSAERAEIVKAAVEAVPSFMNGFTDDGYCSEGAGYWNYGYGHFLEMGLALRAAPEKIDLFGMFPKAKTVAKYGFEYKLTPKTSPRFADGGGSPSDRYLAMCSSIWPDLALDLGLRSCFPDAQVWICRPAAGAKGIALGLKGGHNNEFHNHNDVGSYNVALGDAIMTGDPGGEVYTKRTFSSQRYESKVLNSYAHPVPRVDGALQGTGREFAGKIMKTEFSDGRDVVEIDLAGAYKCDKLVSLVRTFVYDRANASVTVTDRVKFTAPASFEDPVVSLGGFADGAVLSDDGSERLSFAASAKGGDWTWREETVENPERKPPHIKSVYFASVEEAEVTFAFADIPAYEAKLRSMLPEVFAKSAAHYRALDAAATPLMNSGDQKAMVPHGWKASEGKLDMRSIYWWTSGHFPGSLWYLYEATGDNFFKDRATAWTETLAPNSKVSDNHDVGFIMYCSFGNARRLLKTDKYDGLLLETAASLSKRFNPDLGLIRSWGDIEEKKNFLVIPDNMMNLELLEAASKMPGVEARFDKIARSHATKTMAHHFRADGGTYHVLDYDQETLRVKGVMRGQGASCETAWARGQAWAIYGYTMMYRETKDPAYLAFAQKVSDFAIDHPNMPEDGVPYWDFGAPGEERDSSAAAVMASGLLELSGFVVGEKGAKYREFAVKQLLSLSSDAYFAKPGENGNWILKHGVGHKPAGSEIETPLDYGDYYYLEALLRFRALD